MACKILLLTFLGFSWFCENVAGPSFINGVLLDNHWPFTRALVIVCVTFGASLIRRNGSWPSTAVVITVVHLAVIVYCCLQALAGCWTVKHMLSFIQLLGPSVVGILASLLVCSRKSCGFYAVELGLFVQGAASACSGSALLGWLNKLGCIAVLTEQ